MIAERHDFDNAIQGIKLRYGVDLTPDEEGTASLQFREDVICTLELPPDSRFVFFHAIVDRLPEDHQDELLRLVLQANAFGLPVPSAWVALDSETDDILMCAALPLSGLTTETLEIVLSGFAAIIPEFRQSLKEGAERGPPDGARWSTDRNGAAFEVPIRI